MKKAISLLLIFVSVFSLFGCMGNISSQNTPPTFTYLYNTSESHKAIGEYIQSALSVAGLKINLANQEWGTFLNTRKNGEYTLARSGWVADYSDPISFLDMWTSNSGSNDVGFGRGEHKEARIYDLDLREYGYDIHVTRETWSETYDVLIGIIKTEQDNEKRYDLMHLAEDMIMDTGCIMPIYYYTDIYMLSSEVDGFFSSPLGYKFFNMCKYGNNSLLSVCLASEPESLDPALNTTVDGATLISHLFAGLAKWSIDESGNTVIVADCAKELSKGIVNGDGSITYTYTLRDGVMWSDGRELLASDFEYAWRRAVAKETASEYGYMFSVIKGYDEGELAIKALNDKQFEVTLNTPIAYWNELLAFPAYFPVRSDIAENESWASESKTYVSNGPYTMTDWSHNSYITLSKNENYIDAESVTIKTLKFFLSDDANNMLTNFKNGTLQLIDEVPTNEIPSLKRDYEDEFFVKGQIGIYYVCWNINSDILPKSSDLTGDEAQLASAEIRKAISLLIDRNYICEKIGQAGQVPASSFVPMGIQNPDGSEFYLTAGNNDGYSGYFDVSYEAFGKNAMEAVDILRKYYELNI